MRIYQGRYAPLVAFVVLATAGVIGLALVQHRNDAQQDRAAHTTAVNLRRSQVESCRRVNLVRMQVNRNSRTLRRLERVLLSRANGAADPGFKIGHRELLRLQARTHTVAIPDCEGVVAPVP